MVVGVSFTHHHVAISVADLAVSVRFFSRSALLVGDISPTVSGEPDGPRFGGGARPAVRGGRWGAGQAV